MRLGIDGTEFEVRDEGRGTAVVLLHGFPLAMETWDAQAAALAANARVVRLDLRGLGRSGVTPGPYLLEQVAGDVAGVLDALGIERAVIVGHSLGGYVAFAFYRMFAERCMGLGFVATRGSADDPQQVRSRIEMAERMEREGMGPLRDSYLPRFFAPAAYELQPELIERTRAILDRTDPRGAAAMFRGMAMRADSQDLYAEIDVPVRVVVGAQDALVEPAASRAIAAAIHGAALDVFDCGHMPLLEVPDALSASLESLVRTATAAA